MRNSDSVISVSHFRMDFGKKTVIKDLSFDVRKGETFGLLGSNGSGKTTTLRALLGIYRPTSGQLLINNKPFTPEDGGSLGYLPEERGLYKKESVIDVMTYFGTLKGLSKSVAKDWSIEYLKRVELLDKADTNVDKLSGGQQQKIQLGITIINQPKLLILDEPTKGFDPINRRLLMSIIEEQKTAGTTIVMITHQMEEVERLCDRVLLLKDGRAAAYGTIDAIKRQYSSKPVIKLTYTGKLQPSKLFEITKKETNYAELVANGKYTENDIIKKLLSDNLKISRFVSDQASLDDIFVQIYGQAAGEDIQS